MPYACRNAGAWRWCGLSWMKRRGSLRNITVKKL
jgi:hypothetical protein